LCSETGATVATIVAALCNAHIKECCVQRPEQL